MSLFAETDVSEMLFGKSECAYCGRYVACLATHRCSTEQALPPGPVMVDREPVQRPAKWSKA